MEITSTYPRKNSAPNSPNVLLIVCFGLVALGGEGGGGELYI